MKVRMLDSDPCCYLVSSESDNGVEYVVDLCLHPLGLDEDGNQDFNGACISTRGTSEWTEAGCRDFVYRCAPMLKKPENKGKVYRCKHCRAARDYAFRLLLPYVAKSRPNQKED
jgi:hypothetical protein